MTTPPVGCPSCGTPLFGTPTCPSCGLQLTGPLAYQLWQVDQQLAAMGKQYDALQEHRGKLLGWLRSGDDAEAAAAPAAGGQTAPAPPWPGAPSVPQVRRESSPQQVQNTLLTLGAILLAGAGVVFTAVTYRNLGVGGRAAVLLALTAAAALAPTRLLPRGLTASAEAVAAVGVVLALLDVYALRKAGLGEDVDASSYWAGGTALLAVALAGYGVVVPVRAARWAAALLAQLPLPLVLDRADATASAASPLLAVQAGADAALAYRVRLPRDVQALLASLGGVFAFISLVVAVQAVADEERAAWLGFAVLAALMATAALAAPSSTVRDALALPVVPLLAAGAWAAARPELTTDQQPLVLVAAAVLGLQGVALLPRDRRLGAAAGAVLVSAFTVLVEAEAVLQALVGPFTWLGDPWSRTASTARAALGPDLSWDGTVVTLVVLAGAALAVVSAGLMLDRLTPALAPAAVLLVLSAMTLPLGLATSYHDALLLLLLVAGVLCSVGLLLLERLRLVAIALAAAGVCTALLAAAWSLADEHSTLVVLPLTAVLCLALSLALPGALTSIGLLLGASALATFGAHRDLSAEQVGGLLLVALGICTVLALVLRLEHRWGAEAAGAVIATASVVCAVDDPGWTSWTLAGAGVAALAVSTRRDRRLVGLLGGLLLSASSWVRLADAGVEAPEPYVAPLAAAALVAGWFRRRSHPTSSSWEAYGSAIALALVPSLVRAYADEEPTRALLLLAVAVAVALVGAGTRQQAPLALGAVVAVLCALRLLAPYADAVPQWVLLAGLGLLLVVLGVTYEARLRDLRRLRERFDALA